MTSPDAARLDDPPDGGSVRRRTLLRSTIWTVPVIAVAAPAPVFAASPCAGAPFPTGWSTSNPASGTLTDAASNGYGTYGTGGVSRYLSISDNSKTGLESTASNDATVALQTTLALVVGRAYTFTFTIASGFSSNQLSGSQLQKLDIEFNGASIGKYTTNASTSTPALTTGYTVLNTTNGGVTTQTVSLAYTPTASSVILRYLWTLPARGYNPVLGLPTSTYSGNADIAISAPDVSGC